MIQRISAVSLCLLLFSCGGKDEKIDFSKAGMQATGVEVFEISKGDISRIIEIPGTIIPSEEIQLFSEITGRIQKINFKEGQIVKKGALLIQVDTDIMTAQRKQLKVQLDLAQKDESRKKSLLTAKGISTEEYEKSFSALASIQAEIGLIDVQISKGQIRAPFSGRVGLRRVSEGAYITPSTMMTSLVKEDEVKIEFSISERYASLVKPGQSVNFKEGRGDEVYKASVYAYESTISTDSRMLTVRAKMKNDANLFPGTFVSIEYNLGQEKDAMMIPAGSIIPVLKGQKIMVVRNGVVVDVPVELGIRTSDKVQVTGEINAGDQVLTSGLLAVRAGMPVTIKKTKK
jgi:membrane fusion protein (multidrug efflux system)